MGTGMGTDIVLNKLFRTKRCVYEFSLKLYKSAPSDRGTANPKLKP